MVEDVCQLMQSVPFTAKVMNCFPSHGLMVLSK
jgi:hypothetical protein